jgi:hypothetical protein
MHGFHCEPFSGEVLREDFAQFRIVIDEEEAFHAGLWPLSSYSPGQPAQRLLTRLYPGLTVLDGSRSSLVLKCERDDEHVDS